MKRFLIIAIAFGQTAFAETPATVCGLTYLAIQELGDSSVKSLKASRRVTRDILPLVPLESRPTVDDWLSQSLSETRETLEAYGSYLQMYWALCPKKPAE